MNGAPGRGLIKTATEILHVVQNDDLEGVVRGAQATGRGTRLG